MIYWPFHEGAIHSHLTRNQDTTILVDRGFNKSGRRIEDNEKGFEHLHYGTWLMLRSCTRSALVLVAAARSGLRERLPREWQGAVGKVKILLEFWKDEVLEAKDRLQICKNLSRISKHNMSKNICGKFCSLPQYRTPCELYNPTYLPTIYSTFFSLQSIPHLLFPLYVPS
jgi:hypothetical protein